MSHHTDVGNDLLSAMLEVDPHLGRDLDVYYSVQADLRVRRAVVEAATERRNSRPDLRHRPTVIDHDQLTKNLLANDHLGRDRDIYLTVRGDVRVRRAVMEAAMERRDSKPYFQIHQVTIDFDELKRQDLLRDHQVRIDPALPPDRLPRTGTGRHQLDILQLCTGWTLSARKHRRLMDHFNGQPVCRLAAVYLFATLFQPTDTFPVKAQVGQPFVLETPVGQPSSSAPIREAVPCALRTVHGRSLCPFRLDDLCAQDCHMLMVLNDRTL